MTFSGEESPAQANTPEAELSSPIGQSESKRFSILPTRRGALGDTIFDRLRFEQEIVNLETELNQISTMYDHIEASYGDLDDDHDESTECASDRGPPSPNLAPRDAELGDFGYADILIQPLADIDHPLADLGRALGSTDAEIARAAAKHGEFNYADEVRFLDDSDQSLSPRQTEIARAVAQHGEFNYADIVQPLDDSSRALSPTRNEIARAAAEHDEFNYANIVQPVNDADRVPEDRYTRAMEEIERTQSGNPLRHSHYDRIIEAGTRAQERRAPLCRAKIQAPRGRRLMRRRVQSASAAVPNRFDTASNESLRSCANRYQIWPDYSVVDED